MIRLANRGDLNGIYRLICEMEQSELDYKSFEGIFYSQLESACYSCWVWEEKGIVAGCLNLRMERQLHHTARVAEIMELAVMSGCRSRGIGKQLFDYACLEAKREGCVQVEVCCNLLRERAHAFYQRQGMNRFHYKFSMPLNGNRHSENKLGV